MYNYFRGSFPAAKLENSEPPQEPRNAALVVSAILTICGVLCKRAHNK